MPFGRPVIYLKCSASLKPDYPLHKHKQKHTVTNLLSMSMQIISQAIVCHILHLLLLLISHNWYKLEAGESFQLSPFVGGLILPRICGRFELGGFIPSVLLLRNSIKSQIDFMHPYALVTKQCLKNSNTVVPPAQKKLPVIPRNPTSLY